jgi:hypothetical protein
MRAESIVRIPRLNFTAADTLTREQCGSLLTNLGAAGAIELTLPQDAQEGDFFRVAVLTAQAFQISPGAAGAVYFSGAKQTDNKHVWADDEAEAGTIICVGDNDWVFIAEVGTWTIEA